MQQTQKYKKQQTHNQQNITYNILIYICIYKKEKTKKNINKTNYKHKNKNDKNKQTQNKLIQKNSKTKRN